MKKTYIYLRERTIIPIENKNESNTAELYIKIYAKSKKDALNKFIYVNKFFKFTLRKPLLKEILTVKQFIKTLKK